MHSKLAAVLAASAKPLRFRMHFSLDSLFAPRLPHTAAQRSPQAVPERGRARSGNSRKGPQSPGVRECPMENGRDRAWSPWYLLLLIQFVPSLWVPFYNSVEPTFGGMPFFYWFQLALVLVSAGVTAIVYFATERAS